MDTGRQLRSGGHAVPGRGREVWHAPAIGLPAAPRLRTFAVCSTSAAVTMLTTMALAGAGFGQSPRLVNLGGLFQRASIVTGFGWLTALSARVLQGERQSTR
jgi:hypothetical protein